MGLFAALRGGFFIKCYPGVVAGDSVDRQHGIKYRLWAGRARETLVRFDNEAGKGDHKHVGAAEMPYVWRALDAWWLTVVQRWRH